MGEISPRHFPRSRPQSTLFSFMPRKADKYAARIDRKINGRRVRLPADISDFERAGADFVASIFAMAHAENPDEDWLSKCQPHIKVAAMQKGDDEEEIEKMAAELEKLSCDF